uniref:Leucine-rich repeat-containing protein 47-like n=1 Tax=Phallusia mammillata TaxID=59560 RepID=A0A6F9DJZ6_9ASCI|nr:leucine-rich repeat-containing protein 47-like [Phallusia mammillata]
MMSEPWPEIVQASSEKRRELVLKGTDADLKQRVQDADGLLPSELYQLELLNFLQINSLAVRELSNEVSSLKNLSQFFCRQNALTSIPDEITCIKTLKFLDMSENAITELPENIGQLMNLQTLNMAHNKLTCLPSSVCDLASLAILDVSQNNFEEFPDVLCKAPVCERLAEFQASHNNIDDVPDSVENIVMLKVFDLSNNQIKELGRSIAGCLKLKQVNFTSNPLKDKRLKKLIDQKNSQKSIMDYIRTKGRAKQNQNATNEKTQQGKGGRKKLKGQKAHEAVAAEEEALVKYFIDVLKVDTSDAEVPFRVIVENEVKEIRPFIVACIIKNLNLDQGDMFKNFISLQTRIHDEICGKRTIATIATHDMKHLRGSYVVYDAQEPDLFKIRPLGRKAEVTALSLYQKLCKEAEDTRKEKKRNQVSGIHKYLTLLNGQEKFALLRRSSDDCVISLPPLTNCDATKISSETSDVFVEITGTKSLGACKSVMDELLKRMVELGYYSDTQNDNGRDFFDDSSDEDEHTEVHASKSRSLVVQQVKVEDGEGKMRVVYPSRTDMVFETKEIKVRRPK